MAECEICGCWIPDGNYRCYTCNVEFLNRSAIEDGETCFEMEEEPNCPWCGAVLDHNRKRSESEDEPFQDGNWTTCPMCGKDFWLVAETAPRYSTYQINPDGIPMQAGKKLRNTRYEPASEEKKDSAATYYALAKAVMNHVICRTDGICGEPPEIRKSYLHTARIILNHLSWMVKEGELAEPQGEALYSWFESRYFNAKNHLEDAAESEDDG